jgi:hypothetical protein
MKLIAYHVLSLLAGFVTLAICNSVLPITHATFMLLGGYYTLVLVSYICGRIVLSCALPDTYKKLQKSTCQCCDHEA